MSEMIYHSPLGNILIRADHLGVCELSFECRDVNPCENDENFREVTDWLDLYFQKKDPGFTPRLNIEGSEFLKTVCEICRQIPYGSTCSYGQLARKYEILTGKRMSARAIGQAMHRNPVCLIVPCHRVTRKDGSIGGYAHGKMIKQALLDLEQEGLKNGQSKD